MQGVAITSYQGGHVEFFKYMIDLLRENGGENIKVFGGGGGVIVPAEIRELQAYGVTRLYSPEDGAKMGLQGMIDDRHALERLRSEPRSRRPRPRRSRRCAPATAGSSPESSPRSKTGPTPCAFAQAVLQAAAGIKTPVLGITGTGGAGKSSLTDELILRLRLDQEDRAAGGRASRSTRRASAPGARCSAIASA